MRLLVTSTILWAAFAIGLSACGLITPARPVGQGPTVVARSEPRPNQPASDMIPGFYVVEGLNPDGSPYQGELEIVEQGDLLAFTWQLGQQHDGVGIADADRVAVAYGGAACGVALYQINSDGGLNGVWGAAGQGENGAEFAAPLEGALGIAGEYEVEGTNPDGSIYWGGLSVAERGAALEFRWALSEEFAGVGVQQGDVVAVSYGGEGCSVALYEVGGDGALAGQWVSSGGAALGSERASR